MKISKFLCYLVVAFSVAACGPGSNPDGLELTRVRVNVQGLQPGDLLEVRLRSETLEITGNGNRLFETRVDVSRNYTMTIVQAPPARPCRFSNGQTTISSRLQIQPVFCGVGVTTALPLTPGTPIQLRGWSAASALPSLLVATIGVLDIDGAPRTGATLNDFRFFDGENEIVNSTEAPIHVQPVPLTNLTLRTALVLDVSRSFTPEDIDVIKDAALSAVAGIQSFQLMSVFIFDSDVTQLTPFTSNVADLNAAISAISRNPEDRDSSTNLYGAVRAAVQTWDDLVFLDQADIGYAVVITDGAHNANGLTYDDVVEDINGRQIYAVAIGASVDVPALRELTRDPTGRAGNVVQIQSVSDLAGAFASLAQRQINLVSGLHIVYHLSPKRGFGESDEHTFSIEVRDLSACVNTVGDDAVDEGFCRFILFYDSENFVGNSGLILVPSAGSVEPGGQIDFAVPDWLPCGGGTPNYDWSLNVLVGTASGAVVPASGGSTYRITLGPAFPIAFELSVIDLNSPGCAAAFPVSLAP